MGVKVGTVPETNGLLDYQLVRILNVIRERQFSEVPDRYAYKFVFAEGLSIILHDVLEWIDDIGVRKCGSASWKIFLFMKVFGQKPVDGHQAIIGFGQDDILLFDAVPEVHPDHGPHGVFGGKLQKIEYRRGNVDIGQCNETCIIVRSQFQKVGLGERPIAK